MRDYPVKPFLLAVFVMHFIFCQDSIAALSRRFVLPPEVKEDMLSAYMYASHDNSHFSLLVQVEDQYNNRGYYIISANNSGELLWARKFSKNYVPQIQNDGSVFISGEYSNQPYWGRIDSGGNLIYSKKLNTSPYGNSYNCLITTNNEQLCAGQYPSTQTGKENRFIFKANEQGNFLWSKAWLVDKSGSYLISRLNNSYLYADEDSASRSITVFNYQEDGTVLWGKVFYVENAGDLFPDYLYYIPMATKDNSIYIILSLRNDTKKQPLIIKLSSAGNFMWAKSIVTNEFSVVTSMVENEDGSLIVHINSDDGKFDTFDGYSYLVKITPDGDIVSQKKLYGDHQGYGSINKFGNGKIILSSHNKSTEQVGKWYTALVEVDGDLQILSIKKLLNDTEYSGYTHLTNNKIISSTVTDQFSNDKETYVSIVDDNYVLPDCHDDYANIYEYQSNLVTNSISLREAVFSSLSVPMAAVSDATITSEQVEFQSLNGCFIDVTPINDNTEFVKQVYRDFLNREADAGGLAYWTGELNAGRLTRAAMVEQYLLSPEFGEKVSPVTRLYFAYFNRLPDYSGLMYWVNEYASGNRTLNNISDAFAASAEFQTTYGSLNNGQFVDLIYTNLFNRSADSGGKAYWTNELDSGNRTRGQVMVGFSESQEYKDLMANPICVTMTYIGLLRRSPDYDGYNYWVGRMDQGDSGQTLIDLFLNSTEYAARFQ